MNKEEIKQELTETILPFWMKLKDEKYGGLYGRVTYDLEIIDVGEKGGIAAARHLWAFSSSYRVLKDPAYLEMADHMYQFIKEKCIDREYGGVYWMLDYRGRVIDQRKHIYAQAFAIYGLSEYYRVTKNKEALDLALELYDLIEVEGFNEKSGAYKEEFTREWKEAPNVMLSENGVMADVTMNTHIHILEAYTNLYKVAPSTDLKARLEYLLKIHFEKIYQPDHFLGVFFDRDWKSIINLQSFGHDIEASWLMDETVKVLKLEEPKYDQMITDIARNILSVAVNVDGSLQNERENGVVDETRIWWVQAETTLGFYNAYEKTGDSMFRQAAEACWNYIVRYMKDTRPGSEWYWSLSKDNIPNSREIAEPWKVSYHNTRSCLELIERMDKQ
ncbi:mannobiose 2-epimerase [Halolactibacillus halophilus]|uniref:Cellobiose 2-epimerase n=1 Tax=Halolactibacillus halophilus TaxID=306540 RepID=A0A1I5LYA2_9BACI|nr:AGE family epimerase/isomerase [Halolactibacillus halophilus]GEM00918.1 cellobiose 2-epimerase [Halolactibacillus halophilus]SFP01741.1 mannobiose 2-epimerase [Halolactibacillus halophilus]